MNIAPASQSIADGWRTGVAPRIMPDTELGKHAVSGYPRYLGISAADFIRRVDSPPTSSDVATAVIASDLRSSCPTAPAPDLKLRRLGSQPLPTVVVDAADVAALFRRHCHRQVWAGG